MVQLITCKYRGGTPLHAAARKVQEASMYYLLGLGADINARDVKGRTPLLTLLMVKSDVDRREAARYLLQEGAFPDLHDNDGNTARPLLEEKCGIEVGLSKEGCLFQAIARGDVQELSKSLKAFEKGLPPQDQSGATPFHRVVLSPSAHPQEAPYYRPLSLWKEEMIRLLAEKFDINRKNRYGKTALYVAVEKAEHPLAECLLQCGARPDLRSGLESRAPLHVAGTPELVRLLSFYGANLDIREETTQKPPLHIAASQGRSLVVETLLAEGANWRVLDLYGNTVLHACRTYECASSILYAELINAQNQWGAIPLHCAIQRESILWMRTGNLTLIRALAEHKDADLSLAATGITAEVQYYHSLTPLELANRQLAYIRAREGEHTDMVSTFEEIVSILQKALQKQQEGVCILS